MFHNTSMMAFSSCSDGIIWNNYVESISSRSFTVEIFNSLAKSLDVPSFLVKWKKMREE